MTETPIYIGSDNRLRLGDTTLTENDGTRSFQNAGTCSFEIKDLAENLVTDGTTTAEGELAYTTASDGEYLVVIDKAITLLLKRNQRYDVFAYFEEDGNEATFCLRVLGAYQ